jgi:hypothetical protein
MRIYIFTSAMILTGLLTGGCASTPEHMPSPEPKKVITVYSSKYDSVPGTTVVDTQNIRTDGDLEEYYNGRYIDPNTGYMYTKGTVYRITESPHWKTTPNPDPKPYEINEAYKNIKNIVNATPLYAELDNKYQTTKELNITLRKQIEIMKQAKDSMVANNKEIGISTAQLAALQKQNSLLHQQISELEKQAERKETASNMTPDSDKQQNKDSKTDRETASAEHKQSEQSLDF